MSFGPKRVFQNFCDKQLSISVSSLIVKTRMRINLYRCPCISTLPKWTTTHHIWVRSTNHRHPIRMTQIWWLKTQSMNTYSHRIKNSKASLIMIKGGEVARLCRFSNLTQRWWEMESIHLENRNMHQMLSSSRSGVVRVAYLKSLRGVVEQLKMIIRNSCQRSGRAIWKKRKKPNTSSWTLISCLRFKGWLQSRIFWLKSWRRSKARPFRS